MILIIDNYDSFVYNLFQCLGGLGEEVIVKRNNAVTVEEILEISPKKIILSPGPGHPANKKDFGRCDEIISSFHVPILGVCLGHQGIITHFGGKVTRCDDRLKQQFQRSTERNVVLSDPLLKQGASVPSALADLVKPQSGFVDGTRHIVSVERAPKPMHGKTSSIRHNGKGIFEGIKNPLQVMRYHSLAGTEIPDCLEVTATSIEDRVVMAVQHKTLPIYGVQFHPESIMTEDGEKILKNFVRV